MTIVYNYSLSSFSKETITKAPSEELALYSNLHTLDDIAYLGSSGPSSPLSLHNYGDLNKRMAIFLNKSGQVVTKNEIRQALKKIHVAYEKTRGFLFSPISGKSSSAVYPCKNPLEIEIPSKEKPPETPQAIALDTPREIVAPVKESPPQVSRDKVALFMNKRVEDTTEEDLQYYKTVGKDIRSKDKAQKITAIARYLAISELQPYNPCADNLEAEERDILLSLGKEPLSLCDIPQTIPQKNELGYWREVLTLTRNPIILYKIARNAFSAKALEFFPKSQHRFVVAAAQTIIHESLYKADFDKDIFTSFYKPQSSPPEMLRTLVNDIENIRQYTSLATKKVENDDTLPRKKIEDGESYLEKVTRNIASQYAPSHELLHEASSSSIHELLISEEFEKKIQKLISHVKCIRSAFDLEIFCINFHKHVYKLLDQINHINIALKKETLGKEVKRIVAGEDEIIPLSIYIMQRMNDPEVFARLTTLENITDDSFLELHSRHIFARTTGSAGYALDEIKTNFQQLYKNKKGGEKKARYSCFGITG